MMGRHGALADMPYAAVFPVHLLPSAGARLAWISSRKAWTTHIFMAFFMTVSTGAVGRVWEVTL